MRPNWNIISGEHPESVQAVAETLEEMSFKVISSDPNDWLNFYSDLEAKEVGLTIPVFFDRSVEDRRLHRDNFRIDIERITLRAINQYKWRNVFLIDEYPVESNETEGMPQLSETKKLAREYSDCDIPTHIILPRHHKEQAKSIIKRIDGSIIAPHFMDDDMPHMG